MYFGTFLQFPKQHLWPDRPAIPKARVSYDEDEDKLGNSPHPWNGLAHAAATIIKFLPTVIFGRYKIGTEAPSFYIYTGDIYNFLSRSPASEE